MDTSPPTRFYALSFLVKTLRESLLSGRWNQVLPPERELAAQLRVSRFTLRNALRILEEEGLLIIAQGKPTRISIPEAIGPQPKPFHVNLVRLSGSSDLECIETVRRSREIKERLHVACIPWREVNAPPEAIRQALDAAHAEYEQSGMRNLWVLLNSSPALEETFSVAAPGITLLAGVGTRECNLPWVDMHLEAIGRHLGTLANHRNFQTITLLSSPSLSQRGEHLLEGINKTLVNAKCQPLSCVIEGSSLPQKLPALLKKLGREQPSLLVLTSSELLAPVLFHSARGRHSIPGDFSLLSAAGTPDLRSFGIAPAYYEYQETQIAKAIVQQIIDVIHIGNRGFRQHLLIPEYHPGSTMLS